MGKHKEWRKIAKKMRRKRIRQLKAQEKDEKMKEEEQRRAQSPSYKAWLDEQEQLEKFRQEEEERIQKELNEKWLHEEQLANERWKQQQKKLERIKAEKAKQEMIIREEWEREQQKLKEKAEAQQRAREEQEREQATLLDRIDKYVSGESERLPSSTLTNMETQPGAPECPFFAKVAACRFKDGCSRNHIRPSISHTLLFPGFYSNFRIEHVNQANEYDTDVGLEYEEGEIYHHFLEFYEDVLTELKSFGKVVQFKVCCNIEPHLRGNVYVQYSSPRFAIKAFRALQGRFYGGKRITAEFCYIKSWTRALCGLFSRKKCPKGTRCNFLHVFRNPNREFYKADRDIFDDIPKPRSTRARSEEWRWSQSPEPVYRHTQPHEQNNKEHKRKRAKRDNSRSKSRSRSKTEDIKKKKHKEERHLEDRKHHKKKEHGSSRRKTYSEDDLSDDYSKNGEKMRNGK